MDRRNFICLSAAGLALPLPLPLPLPLLGARREPVVRARAKGYGIAWTSIPVRTSLARQRTPSKRPLVGAEEFIELCHSHGAGIVQMGYEQLGATDQDYLKTVRRLLEEREMGLELGVSARLLESEESFAPVARVAKELGVRCLRVACLGGRRYETFQEMKSWQEFASHWKRVLRESEPMLRRHRLRVGIENHKDWLADEQVEILKSISSPWLGACVDFGNNLALLEDSLEVVKKLAPYAVTTHLKDMAVRPSEDGFELSEVVLGEGITPLREIVRLLRRVDRELPIVLEMITRDPLRVPYKTDRYWATYPERDQARIARFERGVLSRASSPPLPHISQLTPEKALLVENENLRRCSEYARHILKV
ncbi:MAG: sugar phosphate isomerase/epimerase family protein [Acidobacteriota bacterium]